MLILEDKLINFEDSIKHYNVGLKPTTWIDAESGLLAKVNPAHIYVLDGNKKYNASLMAFGSQNVWFKPTSQNNSWLFTVANRIERTYGIEYGINVVDEPLPPDGIIIESMEPEYLNSIKDQMGMNLKISSQNGWTIREGNDLFDDLNVYSTADIRVRGPDEDFKGTSSEVTASERELIHRIINCTNSSENYWKSIGNKVFPLDIDTTKMLYDHINYNLIHRFRTLRFNADETKRIHNGSWTTRPNNNSEFYNSKTNSQLYNEERFKHWDDTNIPEMNRKFF